MSKLLDWWLRMASAGSSLMKIGPLRTLRYDDRALGFFTYTGTWHIAEPIDWPGDAYNKSITYRAAVLVDEPTPALETPLIPFSGTAEEGIDFVGASETGGLIRLLIRTPGAAWRQFGENIGDYCYRYNWRISAPHNDDEISDYRNYDMAYMGQSYYSHLNSPGIIQLRGLPKGYYQFRLEKYGNTADPGDNGNRATYFDGCTIHICDSSFS